MSLGSSSCRMNRQACRGMSLHNTTRAVQSLKSIQHAEAAIAGYSTCVFTVLGDESVVVPRSSSSCTQKRTTSARSSPMGEVSAEQRISHCTYNNTRTTKTFDELKTRFGSLVARQPASPCTCSSFHCPHSCGTDLTTSTTS